MGRLQEMGIESFLISSAVLGVLAQRLVRVICTECKESCAIEPGTLLDMGIDDPEPPSSFRGRGCTHCNETGYRGRTGIYELLVIGDEVRQLILSHAGTQEIRERAIQLGMTTLRQDQFPNPAPCWKWMSAILIHSAPSEGKGVLIVTRPATVDAPGFMNCW